MTSGPQPDAPRGIEPRQRRDGNGWVWRYRVRWRDPATGRRLVEEFATVEEALDFRAHLRLATRGGVLDELGRGRVLLRDFVENEWWPKDAGRRLERNTLTTYAPVWNVHIGPRLGHLQVRQLNAPVVQAFKEQMETDGLGAPTTRRALAILQAICRYAIAKGELSSNPVREVRKPAVRRKLEIVAISPTQVESLRRALADDPAGQLLVTLIAYEGLRPEEALALTETHRRKSTLLIEQKNVDGQIVPGQKRRRADNGRDSRSRELFGPVRADIAQYLLAARGASPSDATLLFRVLMGFPGATTTIETGAGVASSEPSRPRACRSPGRMTYGMRARAC